MGREYPNQHDSTGELYKEGALVVDGLFSPCPQAHRSRSSFSLSHASKLIHMYATDPSDKAFHCLPSSKCRAFLALEVAV